MAIENQVKGQFTRGGASRQFLPKASADGTSFSATIQIRGKWAGSVTLESTTDMLNWTVVNTFSANTAQSGYSFTGTPPASTTTFVYRLRAVSLTSGYVNYMVTDNNQIDYTLPENFNLSSGGSSSYVTLSGGGTNAQTATAYGFVPTTTVTFLKNGVSTGVTGVANGSGIATGNLTGLTSGDIITPQGTVNGTSATAVVAAASNALPINARIAVLGDSNTDYGTSLASGLLQNAQNNHWPQISAMGGQYNTDVFPAWFNAHQWQGWNNGIAGEAYAGINSRLNDVLTYLPDAVEVAGGTNDGLDSPGVGAAKAAPYITQAQTILAAGVPWVFMRAVLPLASPQFTSGRNQARLEFNAAFKAFADANPTRVKYFDFYTTTTNPDGSAITGYLLADGLHTTEYGAYLNATIAKAVLDPITASSTNELVANALAGNIIVNAGNFSGTGGSVGSGITGTLPDGWGATVSGTPTVAASLSSNVTSGGQNVTFTITPAAGTGTDTLTFTPTANLSFVANNWYRGYFEVEQTGVAGLVNNTMFTQPIQTSYTTTSVASMVAQPRITGSQWIRLPSFRAAANTKPSITIQIPRGGSAFTVIIKRASIVPTANPYSLWNSTTVAVNSVAPSCSGTQGTGNVVTLNPGTWAPVPTGTQSTTVYQARLFRNDVYIQTISWLSGNGSYTQVAADASATSIYFRFSAANHAEGRTAEIEVPFVADTVAPVLSTATAAQTQQTIVLTYSKLLNTAIIPATSAFTISNSGGTDTVTGVSISGTTVTITKSRVTASTDTITLTYTQPATNKLQDLHGNFAASLTSQAVTNTLPPDVFVRLTSLGAVITESVDSNGGYDYSSTNGGGFSGLAGAASGVKLPSGQDGYFGNTSRVGNTVLSFKLTAGNSTWNSGIIGFYANIGSNYTTFGANSTTVNTLAAQTGDVQRIRRVGTTAFCEVARAATPTTFVVLASYTGVTTADLYMHQFCSTSSTNMIVQPFGSYNVA